MEINHIAMYVLDIEKMKEFYIRYFNAQSGNKYHNKNSGLKTYFLSFENNCRLELMTMDNIIYKDNMQNYLGYTHIALSVGSKRNVDIITAKIKKSGYKVISEPRNTGDEYYESCILDPENNRIEITI